MKRPHVACTDIPRSGRAADACFARTREDLKARGVDRHVCMEAFLKPFPSSACWRGDFAGLSGRYERDASTGSGPLKKYTSAKEFPCP